MIFLLKCKIWKCNKNISISIEFIDFFFQTGKCKQLFLRLFQFLYIFQPFFSHFSQELTEVGNIGRVKNQKISTKMEFFQIIRLKNEDYPKKMWFFLKFFD